MSVLVSRTDRRSTLLVVALLLALVAVVVIVAQPSTAPRASTGETPSPDERVPRPLPDLTLQRLDGGTLELASLRGRPVLLNFWASWCPPCRDEFPVLARAAADHVPVDLAVIGIVHNDGPEHARAFVAETGATWPMLLDPDGAAWLALGGAGLPTSVLVDADGGIRATWYGPLTDADVLRLVEGLAMPVSGHRRSLADGS